MKSSPPLSQLVIEAGFAAINLGLQNEMRDILASLPDWLEEPDQLAQCEALLLFGLGRKKAALARLDTLAAQTCLPLRALLCPANQE